MHFIDFAFVAYKLGKTHTGCRKQERLNRELNENSKVQQLMKNNKNKNRGTEQRSNGGTERTIRKVKQMQRRKTANSSRKSQHLEFPRVQQQQIKSRKWRKTNKRMQRRAYQIKRSSSDGHKTCGARTKAINSKV